VATDSKVARKAVEALAAAVGPTGPMRELRLERVDRVPVAESALGDALRDAGFRPSYRGWILRRDR